MGQDSGDEIIGKPDPQQTGSIADHFDDRPAEKPQQKNALDLAMRLDPHSVDFTDRVFVKDFFMKPRPYFLAKKYAAVEPIMLPRKSAL